MAQPGSQKAEQGAETSADGFKGLCGYLGFFNVAAEVKSEPLFK